ncbi:AAA family ATPase [Chryseobacterium sp. RU33C]|uniref:AAA family ATPase n=1 Tax=Chryseobacterium sp. RU33C TaxID=1907398 RepID=UPI000955896F|nr:AAA family ATPase [Chryseobacterium sp. RU33C]SIR25158.1 Predicted ATPase [Chryseobacterium sp. RU33C]
MQISRLIVKNFGPLKDIDILVPDFLCLIGKQATGKSTIAKLIAIFEDENFRNVKEKSIKDELEKYGMLNFLQNNSIIHFYKGVSLKKEISIGTNFHFEYNEGEEFRLNFKDIFKNKIKKLYLNDKFNKEEIKKYFEGLIFIDLYASKKVHPNIAEFYNLIDSSLVEPIVEEDLDKIFTMIEEVFEENGILVKYDSQYIPSERNFLHIIAENTLGLINNNVQIPKHLLEIGQEYEKALNVVNEVPLSLIDKKFKYKREGKISYVYHDKIKKINLLQSASGLQSILPIILLIEYAKTLKDNYYFNYVIEEPELNIYPETQSELMKYLVQNVFDFQESFQKKKMIITTHSPYILASINNMLLAFRKGQEKPKETSKIIKKKSWINPEFFNAYELKNGKSFRIMNDKIGQIKGNIIDKVTDGFSDEFDKLLSL